MTATFQRYGIVELLMALQINTYQCFDNTARYMVFIIKCCRKQFPDLRMVCMLLYTVIVC